MPFVVFLTQLLHPHEKSRRSSLLPVKMIDDDMDGQDEWKQHAINILLPAKDLILHMAERERKGEIMMIGCERLIACLGRHLSRRNSLQHQLLAMDFIVLQLRFQASRLQAVLRNDPPVVVVGQQGQDDEERPEHVVLRGVAA